MLLQDTSSRQLAAERFVQAYGGPSTPAPTHLSIKEAADQQDWEAVYATIGGGWFRNGFLYLFGERLQELDALLEPMAHLWPQGQPELSIFGKNAYGDLLIVEAFSERGFEAPVVLFEAEKKLLHRNPAWNFLTVIGEQLPSMEFAFFLQQDHWYTWLENEQLKPKIDECIITKPIDSEKEGLQKGLLQYYLTDKEVVLEATSRSAAPELQVPEAKTDSPIVEKVPLADRPEEVIYNCHVHLFNIDYIPKFFLNRFLPITILKRQWLANNLYRVFRPFVHRYSAFFFSALHGEPKEILEELQYYYPKGTRFVPLSVDFDFMKAGKPIKNFHQQLEDLAQLRDQFPYTIYPFIGVDPRRADQEDLLALIKKYIEERQFSGLKFYPSLGFFPNDPRLDPIFAYAEANELPLTTHCIPINKNHYRGSIAKLDKSKATEIPGFIKKNTRSAYRFAQYYNHPYWWSKVLERYPKLKINFGHFGGAEEWTNYLDKPREQGAQSWYRYIRRLMENPDYPNVYADISFTVHDRTLYPVLKNLMQTKDTRPYVLFGSDFYMLQKDYRERRFGLDVRGYLTDDDYWQLAEINAKRFLKTKVVRTATNGA